MPRKKVLNKKRAPCFQEYSQLRTQAMDSTVSPTAIFSVEIFFNPKLASQHTGLYTVNRVWGIFKFNSAEEP